MGQSSFGINYKTTFDSTTRPILPAGLLARGTNKAGEFVFVKASAAIAQYAAVGVDGSGNASELTTTTYANSGIIGFAQVDVALGEYFWLFVGNGGGAGVGIMGKGAASYVAYRPINTTATAGVVDDATTKTLGGVVGITTLTGADNVELVAAGPITKLTL